MQSCDTKDDEEHSNKPDQDAHDTKSNRWGLLPLLYLPLLYLTYHHLISLCPAPPPPPTSP